MAANALQGINGASARLLLLAFLIAQAIEACKKANAERQAVLANLRRIKRPKRKGFTVPYGLLAQILLDPRNVNPFRAPDYNRTEGG